MLSQNIFHVCPLEKCICRQYGQGWSGGCLRTLFCDTRLYFLQIISPSTKVHNGSKCYVSPQDAAGRPAPWQRRAGDAGCVPAPCSA